MKPQPQLYSKKTLKFAPKTPLWVNLGENLKNLLSYLKSDFRINQM